MVIITLNKSKIIHQICEGSSKNYLHPKNILGATILIKILKHQNFSYNLTASALVYAKMLYLEQLTQQLKYIYIYANLDVKVGGLF